MNARRILFLFVLLNFIQCSVIAYLVQTRSAVSTSIVPSRTAVQVSRPQLQKNFSPVAETFNWRRIESTDYRAYIANLRAIGCPEETVRDIIIADVNKLFSACTRSIKPRQHKQYWEPEDRQVTTFSSSTNGITDRTLENEKRALLKELLGVDVAMERRKNLGDEDMSESRLSFLPDDKRARVTALLEKYAELEQALQDKVTAQGGKMNPDQKNQLKALRDAQHDELSAILSPREAELYELWTSNAAISTRASLSGMDSPTEQDFLTIYRLRKRLETEFPADSLDLSDPATANKWMRANAQIEQQIRAQLGEDRYAQYRRGQDQNYQQLAEISRQYELPQDAAGTIYALRQQVEESTETILSQTNMSESQRTSALEPIRREAEKSVREIMGETAFQYYRRQGNAEWLQNN